MTPIFVVIWNPETCVGLPDEFTARVVLGRVTSDGKREAHIHPAAAAGEADPGDPEAAGEVGGQMPEPPAGFEAYRCHDGDQRLVPIGVTRQVTHLVRLNEDGQAVGLPFTECGLTLLDQRDHSRRVRRKADIPGWSRGGGTSGHSVEQVRCPGCWAAADPTPPSGDPETTEDPTDG